MALCAWALVTPGRSRPMMRSERSSASLAAGPLPAANSRFADSGTLTKLAQAAFAYPVNTTVDYAYNAAAQTVDETYRLHHHLSPRQRKAVLAGGTIPALAQGDETARA